MAHCINIHFHEYTQLLSETKLGQRELKARIAAWQELHNNLEAFPTAEEVMKMTDGVTSQANPLRKALDRVSYIRDRFPTLNSNTLSTVVDNIIKWGKGHMIPSIARKVNSLESKLEVDRNYQDTFLDLLNTVTSPADKKALLQELGVSDDWVGAIKLRELAEGYSEFTYGDESFSPTTLKIFDRLRVLQNATRNGDSSALQDVVRKSTPVVKSATEAYQTDLKTYNEDTNTSVTAWTNRDARKVRNALQRKYPKQRVNSDTFNTKRKSDGKELSGIRYTVEQPKLEDYNTFSSEYTQEQMDNFQESRQKLFGDKTESTAKEVLKTMSKEIGIAKELLKVMSNDINIVLSEDTLLTDWEGNENYGQYDSDSNTITLSLAGSTPATVMHEIIHGITSKYLINNPNSEIAQELNELYEFAKNSPELMGKYQFANVREFIAETFSNNSFQRDMAKTRAMENGTKRPNLFRQLWDSIAKILGIKKDKLLYQAITVGSHVIHEANQWNTNNMNASNLLDVVDYQSVVETFETSETAPKRNNNNNISEVNERVSQIFDASEISEIIETITLEAASVIDYYQEEWTELTRGQVVNKIGVGELFNDIKGNLEATLYDLKEVEGNEAWVENLELVLANLDDILQLSITEIGAIEDIRFGRELYTIMEAKRQDALDSGENADGMVEDESVMQEENTLEGWQVQDMHTSVGSSLSTLVRKYLRNIDLLDSKGNPHINLLGYTKKIDPGYATNIILEAMQEVTTSTEFMPIMEKMAEQHPWAKSIVDALLNDNEFFTQFYVNYQKHHVNYSVTKSITLPNGTKRYESININTTDDATPLIDEWKNLTSLGIVVSNAYSMYNLDKTINKPKTISNVKAINALKTKWKEVLASGDIQARLDFIDANSFVINDMLKGVGVNMSIEGLETALSDSLIEGNRGNFNLDTLLTRAAGINMWASKQGDDVKSTDIYNSNKGNYRAIANVLVKTMSDAREGAVNQGGKNYWSYLKPNYLSKTIRNLKSGNQEWLQREFKEYEGTLYNPADGTYNIHWLNELYGQDNSEGARALLDHKIELTLDSTEYSKLSDSQYQEMLLSQYFIQNNYAYYHVPIMAEAPVARFIKFSKYTTNYKDIVPKKLAETVFIQEYNTMLIARARAEGIANNTILPIKNFDKHGDNFQMLTFLNEHKAEIDKLYAELENPMASKSKLLNFVESKIREGLEVKSAEAVTRLREQGLLDTNDKGQLVHFENLKYNNGQAINTTNIADAIGEYYYNSYLASANIIQLTTTDLRYYANVEDFQKRFKQVNAPGEALNTLAMYKGDRVGKDIEKYAVLKDIIVPSTAEVLTHIEKALSQDPHISKKDVERIKALHDANNITDGSAIRTLDSAKSVIAMHKGWNDRLETAYQALKEGKWDFTHYDTIFQAFKPYMYAQNSRDSGVPMDSEGGANYKLKVPTQHKNAEFILLPQYAKQFESPLLQGILDAMNKHNLDVVMFESAVKVGLQGTLDISEMTEASQVVELFDTYASNKEVFKEARYEDYVIQQPVSDHLRDVESLFGTQTRAHMISNVHAGQLYNLNGREMNGQEVKQLYHNAIIENVLQSYEQLLEVFKDPMELQTILQDEILNNPSRFSRDLLHALNLDENGEFNLPLFDHSQANRIEQLLNSVWKSRVTKQKIKGGKAVNMTSVGVEDQLELKYTTDANGNVNVEYMEVLLPWWSDDIAEMDAYLDKSTGIMDVNRMLADGVIDPKLLEIIGYRIPTEGHYSVWPLKVVGFLHRNGGNNIVMPKEVTTILGVDFDIDTMYLMFKEHNFTGKKFEMLEYDMSQDVSSMSTAQRNNLLMDIMSSIAKHPEMASHRANPGNFDLLKASSRRLDIATATSDYTWEQLEAMSLEELIPIADSLPMDIMDFTDQVRLFKKNMIAGQLIGIVANHSVHHALRQDTQLAILPVIRKNKKGELFEANRFTLNGKFNTDLHATTNPEGNDYISRAFSSASAASVDAVKDPVLDGMNFNPTTADVAMMLTGLGYTENEIGLFLRQPIVMEWVREAERNGGDKSGAIKTLLNKDVFKLVSSEEHADTFKKIQISYDFKNKDLAKMIMSSKKMAGLGVESVMRAIKGLGERGTTHFETLQYIKYQRAVLYNLQNMLKPANELSDFIAASKAPSGNGGAGPTHFDNVMNMRKLDTHVNNTYNERTSLTGGNVLHRAPRASLENIAELREFLRQSPMGYVQAFTTLGWEATETQFKKYFPHYNDSVQDVFDRVTEHLPNQRMSLKTMKLVYNNYMAYHMSQSNSHNIDNADYYINEFPALFNKTVQDNPHLKDMSLISSIRFTTPTLETPVNKLNFRAGGRLNGAERDKIMREWANLYNTPETKQLALDIFKYNYYTSGYSFTPNSFAHLAPTAIKLASPGYVQALRTMKTNPVIYDSQKISHSLFSAETLNQIYNSDGVTTIEMDLNGAAYNMNTIGDYLEIHDAVFKAEASSEGGVTSLSFTPMASESYVTKENLDTFVDQFYRNNLSNPYLVPILESPDLSITDQLNSDKSTIIAPQDILNTMIEGNMVFNYIGLKTNKGIEYFKLEVEHSEGENDGTTMLIRTTPLNLGKEFMVYDHGNDHAESPIKKLSVEDVTAQYQNPALDQSYYDSLKDSMSEGEWASLQGSYGEITDSMEFNLSDTAQPAQQIPTAPIKEGVADVFNVNKTLSSIGTQSQYSSYLETIFPDSKVKDIVYHGTKAEFNNFDAKYLPKADAGFYFSLSSEYAKNFGKVKPVLLNVKNPNRVSTPININTVETLLTTEFKKGMDAIIGKEDVLDLPQSNVDVIIPLNENQIHILGTQQDMQGFRDFVQGNNTRGMQNTTQAVQAGQITPSGTINVYWGQAESNSSTRLLSNLAERRFRFKSSDNTSRMYGSVEHAYQSNKNGTFDKTTYNAYNKHNGYGVKISPRLTNRSGNLQLMKDLVVESFRQNPNSTAAKKLLQYENFTHNTNTAIDVAFLEGLKLAQTELLQRNNTRDVQNTTLVDEVGRKEIEDAKNKCK